MFSVLRSNMVFQCINIRQVPREVLKTAASGLGFQHLPRDLVNEKPCLIPIIRVVISITTDVLGEKQKHLSYYPFSLELCMSWQFHHIIWLSKKFRQILSFMQ